ncbi:MAG: hypothetical protein IKH30_01555 [Clostridia bacterium]|nr:hypothetical protein [Clostridia bacterium]MBR4537239.1 hypothetical protein [Clostridia bacterium]MBR4540530.1 hypothetical protein [Clostridia bacterium]
MWQAGQKKETEAEKTARVAHNTQMLSLPYTAKVAVAESRIRDWQTTCEQYGKNYAVSVGGLDSITLLALCREVLGHCDGISVSILEDKSIQSVHKEMGVIPIKPLKSKVQVLREYGYPIVSKQASAKISRLQTSGDTSPIIKAYMTGEEGAWGKHKTNLRFKLPDKWVKLFGGLYGEFRPDLNCQVAPFKVSDQCCYWLKEEPARRYQEEHNIWPFLGLMQSEGGRRQYSLRMHGCNYVGKDTARSCPFNFFSRQDLLQLALDLHVHVPEIYGEIVRDADGTLRTTKAQRTGCSMCGYGIHLDKRPHHFDLLYQRNPDEWRFWMYDQGWGEVLDYIGVGWRPEDLPGAQNGQA